MMCIVALNQTGNSYYTASKEAVWLLLARVYKKGKKSVVLRISPFKRALESAKVNVVGASRTYVKVWYLLTQTCTRVQPYSVPACTPRSSLRVHAE